MPLFSHADSVLLIQPIQYYYFFVQYIVRDCDVCPLERPISTSLPRSAFHCCGIRISTGKMMIFFSYSSYGLSFVCRPRFRGSLHPSIHPSELISSRSRQSFTYFTACQLLTKKWLTRRSGFTVYIYWFLISFLLSGIDSYNTADSHSAWKMGKRDRWGKRTFWHHVTRKKIFSLSLSFSHFEFSKSFGKCVSTFALPRVVVVVVVVGLDIPFSPSFFYVQSLHWSEGGFKRANVNSKLVTKLTKACVLLLLQSKPTEPKAKRRGFLSNSLPLLRSLLLSLKWLK